MSKKKPPQLPKKSLAWPPDELEDWIFLATKSFCNKYEISPYERDDLDQFVKLRLIEKKASILLNYRNEARIKTYVYAVILNFCREFMRKNNSKSVFTEKGDHSIEMSNIQSNDGSVLKDMSIDMEIQRLNRALLIQGSKTPKTVISLKTYFDIPLEWQDIFQYTNDNELTIKHFALFKEITKPKKSAVMAFLTRLFNECENKTNSEDAIRKWVERTIQSLVELLNAGGSRAHNKETLGIMMEIKFRNTKGE